MCTTKPVYIPFYESDSPFSNFYQLKTPMIVDNKSFSTSEHLYMYKKAMFFEDHVTAALIPKAKSPMAAKSLGRKVAHFNEEKWKKVRKGVMYSVLLEKFSCNPELRSILIETGDAVLVEASPRDTTWGVGVGAALATDPKNWKGINLLGYSLMKARDHFNEC